MALEAFQFKQFSVAHDRCAMKVGTDAVLLGAWAPVNPTTKSILDIGSGSGILALMLAQRCNADLIDGLEIDGEAYEQCVTNFESSPWADRLFCYHASLKAYTNEMDIKYDFIISNPPFYNATYTTNNESRNTARFEAAMPFNELLKSVRKLLSKNGRFCVIIPFKSEKKIVEIGKENTLFSDKILRIRGQKNSIIKRSLLSFCFEKKPVEINEIYLEEKRHIYSKEFINLTKEFYLKF
jgi:tRNA1Val (adenine37-N6)-methyltransferase